jgi:hypothetical protein
VSLSAPKSEASIPKLAHFIWLGKGFLWVHGLAVSSAARHGGFERVVLHHDGALESAPSSAALASLPRVELQQLHADALLEGAGGGAFVDCYRELTAPAARANLLRLALLAEHGGVYLDTDTVTLQSFDALLHGASAFCGEERIVFPATRASPLARVHPASLLRMAARDVLRRLPRGYRAFRRIERFYPTAVNNAVLGARPRHPLVAELVRRASTMSPERRRVRYALGTHLLQAVVAEHRGDDLRVLPPEVFFPLAPEISEHWFRPRRHAELDAVLDPQTLLVHWYASVRTERYVARIDERYVSAHAKTELFSALAARALG